MGFFKKNRRIFSFPSWRPFKSWKRLREEQKEWRLIFQRAEVDEKDLMADESIDLLWGNQLPLRFWEKSYWLACIGHINLIVIIPRVTLISVSSLIFFSFPSSIFFGKLVSFIEEWKRSCWRLILKISFRMSWNLISNMLCKRYFLIN